MRSWGSHTIGRRALNGSWMVPKNTAIGIYGCVVCIPVCGDCAALARSVSGMPPVGQRFARRETALGPGRRCPRYLNLHRPRCRSGE